MRKRKQSMYLYTKRQSSKPYCQYRWGIHITSTIEAKQNKDIMTADIPNVFVQTDIKREDHNKIIMKIRRQLVNILTKLESSIYAKYVSKENDSSILYVRMVKALYGMLTSALLIYNQFKNDIEEIGF